MNCTKISTDLSDFIPKYFYNICIVFNVIKYKEKENTYCCSVSNYSGGKPSYIGLKKMPEPLDAKLKKMVWNCIIPNGRFIFSGILLDQFMIHKGTKQGKCRERPNLACSSHHTYFVQDQKKNETRFKHWAGERNSFPMQFWMDSGSHLIRQKRLTRGNVTHYLVVFLYCSNWLGLPTLC